jgi:hypothetical protein
VHPCRRGSGCQRPTTTKFSNSHSGRNAVVVTLDADFHPILAVFRSRGTPGDSHSHPRLRRYGNRRMCSPRLHSVRRRTVVWLTGDRQIAEDNLSPVPDRPFGVKPRTVGRFSVPIQGSFPQPDLGGVWASTSATWAFFRQVDLTPTSPKQSSQLSRRAFTVRTASNGTSLRPWSGHRLATTALPRRQVLNHYIG